MNDVKQAMSRLGHLIQHCIPENLSLGEQAGLWAAVRILCDDLDAHVREQANEDGYAFEKIGQIKWHVGTALGFDVDNGHPPKEHRVWALGSLESLQSRLNA